MPGFIRSNGAAGSQIEVLEGRIPMALADFLHHVFGDRWREWIGRLVDFLRSLPWNHAARKLCEELGFC